jgi:hypothetical protein
MRHLDCLAGVVRVWSIVPEERERIALENLAGELG